MGLMDILNGMQNGPRGQKEPGKGGMSPITMAILALLAYKAYGKMSGGPAQNAPAGRAPQPDNQGGGIGDLLGGLLGGGRSPSAGGGGLGDLLGGKGGAGGLGDLLGGKGGAGGGMGNVLGGLLGGAAAGGLLNGGLKDLLNSFEKNGQGDAAGSWVGPGQNKQISPHELRRALGDDTVNSLAEQAGLSDVDLLDGMSQQLPHFVDQLTPDGRLPTDDEMSRLI